MPLVPQVTLYSFEKWATDFVGPIGPPKKKTSARYIITVTDYLTRWAEIQLVRDFRCNVNKRDWDLRILMALWPYRTTCNKLTGKTPFRLVYG